MHRFGLSLVGLLIVGMGLVCATSSARVYRREQQFPRPLARAQDYPGLVAVLLVVFAMYLLFEGGRMTVQNASYDVQRFKAMANSPLKCSDIHIFTLRGCPWCVKAMDALREKQLKFRETEYTRDMKGPPPKMPNGQVPTFFPQIWVDGVNMGGYGEMDAWVGRCKM